MYEQRRTVMDDDEPFRGPVIGVCPKCLAPIHAGPNEFTMVKSCDHKYLALMFDKRTPAAGEQGEKK